MKHMLKLAIIFVSLLVLSLITLLLFMSKKLDIKTQAKNAYIYFYPLVQMDRLKHDHISKHAPVNKFKHYQKLLTYKDRDVVSPNNDTLYSIAWLDLKKEPLILHVPDTKGRYYVIQLNDAYTNNFKNIGSRTTGTKENYFALIGPNFKGDLPDNIKKIYCPTNMVWLLGRTLVDGKKDMPNVIKIQKQYTLTPWSRYQWDFIDNNEYETWKPSSSVYPDFTKDPIEFWKKAVLLVQDNPTPKEHEKYFSKFNILGITKQVFNPTLISEKAARKMFQVAMSGPDKLKTMLKQWQSGLKNINNWLLNTKTIGTYGDNFDDRAIVALGYIGALVPQEAVYPICKKDKAGKILTGKNKYTIHFDKNNFPPVKAFWSITMYNAKNFFLVKNPIERYSIGNRTPEIQKNPDGSLDIFIQHEKPTDLKQLANWLPAPQGEFYLILRMYNPSKEVIEGKYEIPPVIKQKKPDLLASLCDKLPISTPTSCLKPPSTDIMLCRVHHT